LEIVADLEFKYIEVQIGENGKQIFLASDDTWEAENEHGEVVPIKM
jgi:hypothetical protein